MNKNIIFFSQIYFSNLSFFSTEFMIYKYLERVSVNWWAWPNYQGQKQKQKGFVISLERVINLFIDKNPIIEGRIW